MNLFQTLESTAKRGADGLTPETRNEFLAAILRDCAPDGGHTDLSKKKSDPYYSLFAWLCLRALTIQTPASLDHYFKTCRADHSVDRFCKAFVNIYTLPPFRRKLATARFLLCNTPRDPYSLFLAGLFASIAFPSLVRVLPRLFNKKTGTTPEALSTSRIAARLVMSSCESQRQCLRDILLARHAATGGFSSVMNTPPDLLATAAARFALAENRPPAPSDLLFAEACWRPDGLFAPLPGLPEGDVEHTYYALIVLEEPAATDFFWVHIGKKMGYTRTHEHTRT